jgi:chaperone BCS1
MNLLDQIITSIGGDNDFFKGGLLLGVLGFLAAWLRNLPLRLYHYVRIRLVHTLRIDSEEDTLFEALGKLLNSPEVKVRTRTYRLVLEGGYSSRGQKPLEAIRRHFNADYFGFSYRGFSYYVDFEESKPDNGRYRSHFVYRISSYWRAKAAIQCLLEALAAQVKDRADDELDIYHRHEGYFQQSLIKKRSLDSLYYPQGLLDDLLGDIHSFLNSQAWYARLGIPYRRAYLLYGEPGTGKTSLIKGIASLLDKPLYVIGEGALVLDGGLGGLFRDIPPGSVVVIEDFDRLFMRPDHKMSMAGLLNQLDGLEAKEGLMIFITANHRKVFDAALERPGRIDRKFYIGYMAWPSARKMFLNFYGEEHLGAFEAVWLDGIYSPAQLQVYFSKYKHDPQAAVGNFPNLPGEIGEEKGLQALP